jgi:tetratricopeptide (TPR) repeat protein
MGLIASATSRFVLRAISAAISAAVMAAVLGSFATPGFADDQSLCAKGRPDEIIAACTRIIDSRQLTGNRLASAYANRGRAWAGKKEAAHAAADYKEALRLNPTSRELLGRALLALLANGEVTEAIELAERVVQADRNDGIAHLALGVHALKQEQYPIARNELAQSIRGPVTDLAAALLSAWTMATPAEAEAATSSIDRLAGADWYALFKDLHAALILDLAGQSNEAAARYERTYKRDPTMLRVVQSYGSFLSRQGSSADALKMFATFDEALPRHPLIVEAMDELNAGKKLPPMIDTPQAGAAEVLYGLGAALGRRGGEDLGLIYLQLALYLAPSHPLALLSLGDLYEAMKKPELANKTYERVPANSPLQRNAQIQLAINLDTLDRTDEAKARLEKLIAANPRDVEAIMALGNVLRNRKQFAECADVYSKVIATITKDEKSNWVVYYYRGICYERAKQWPKAEADLKKALELYPEQPHVLNYLGYSWVDQGINLDEGMSMIKRAVEQRADDGYIVDSLGWAYYRLGNMDEAVRHLEKAAKLKREDPTINDHLGDVYRVIGRKADAQRQWKRARELKPEPDDLIKIEAKIQSVPESLASGVRASGGSARSSTELAQLNRQVVQFRNAGKYSEAIPIAERALDLAKRLYGPEHLEVAKSLGTLAILQVSQGRYAEAESLYKRGLAIKEKALGLEHPDVGLSLNNLAILYRRQGRYTEAEPLYKRDLAILEKTHGPNHPDVATSVDNLGVLYETQGRYAEAEPLFKRSIAIREKGRDPASLANSLVNLAAVYVVQERYAEAEPLYKRALTLLESALGRNHPEVGTLLSRFGGLYYLQHRYAEAEPLHKRALLILESALGPEHPSVAESLNAIAALYEGQGRYAEAEPLFKKAIGIREKVLGPNNSEVGTSVHDLAVLYRLQGRYADAEPLYKRALAIDEKELGKNHPNVANVLIGLTFNYQNQGNYADALALSRRASAAVIAHAQTEGVAAQKTSGSKGLIDERVHYFQNHVTILYAARRLGIESEASLAQEGFETAQWAIQSSAAAALAQMATRQAKGETSLARTVRDRQDLERQWRQADQGLNAAIGRGDANLASTLRPALSALEAKLAEIDARLARDFPDYAELSNPKPLSIADAQALLGPDEALLFWLANSKESYVFALTRDGSDWKSIPLGAEALAQKVAAFRRGLDVDVLHRGLERLECTQIEADKRGLSRVECGQVLAKECQEAEKRGLARSDCATGQAQRELFDLGLAHELYEALLGPVEPLIKDKRHLMVVPSGALTALPFHLLVTGKSAPAAAGDLAAYRNAAWLIKRHAVSVLPSVASLKAVRVFARKDEAKQPLIGFGDPVFNAEEEGRPGAENRTVVATRSYTEFWKGVDIDRSQLSKALPRLPETAAELRAVAKNLGAPEASIHLRADASESTVKHAALSDYRVVYFATHGLVAGEIKGLAEPSLALTLPKQPSDLDDGLLTASEVAQLKLNADWVVLSACNTIAGDKPGPEALSGLARAFFYAGARALLVSHWAVESNAAMRLTTSTFGIMKKDPTLGRAEALRRAMLAYMNDAANPLNAYPALWAPFVVVGEGAAR